MALTRHTPHKKRMHRVISEAHVFIPAIPANSSAYPLGSQNFVWALSQQLLCLAASGTLKRCSSRSSTLLETRTTPSSSQVSPSPQLWAGHQNLQPGLKLHSLDACHSCAAEPAATPLSKQPQDYVQHVRDIHENGGFGSIGCASLIHLPVYPLASVNFIIIVTAKSCAAGPVWSQLFSGGCMLLGKTASMALCMTVLCAGCEGMGPTGRSQRLRRTCCVLTRQQCPAACCTSWRRRASSRPSTSPSTVCSAMRPLTAPTWPSSTRSKVGFQNVMMS